MYAHVFIKDSSGFSLDVAHLYEHLLLQSSAQFIGDHLDINCGVIGYLGGTTYKNIIFVEIWLYEERVNKLFLEYLTKQYYNEQLLDTCIEQCQAEDRVLWTIKDRSMLSTQLSKLNSLPWKISNRIKPYEYSEKDESEASPIISKKSASSFKSYAVGLHLNNGSIEEKAVFLRFEVIIHDIIGHFLAVKGWYRQDYSSIKNSLDYLWVKIGYTLLKGKTTAAKTENEIIDMLNSFNVDKNMDYIKAHFAAFAQQKLWDGRIREEIKNNNIVVGNKHIALLATNERLKSIIDKLEISVSPISYAQAKRMEDVE